jgi:hypothetical protein
LLFVVLIAAPYLAIASRVWHPLGSRSNVQSAKLPT